MLWLIDTVVAPPVLHVSVEAAPDAMEVGDAVSVAVGGTFAMVVNVKSPDTPTLPAASVPWAR
jgi:hypothetical protein